MVYEKQELFEQKEKNYEINGILWKIKQDYAVCLKMQ
jgi:hypothetical protein